MKDIAVEVNENLFAAYVGLTTSGYDLANKDDLDVQRLIAQIRSMDLDRDVLYYFRQARTDKYAVNPYWPRGSYLSSASLFVDSANRIDLDAYLAFEESSAASKEYEDVNIRGWISRLPVFLGAIKAHSNYYSLWTMYQAIVDSRVDGYRTRLGLASKRLTEFGISNVPGRRLVFVPNLLQAQADFVNREGRLYVITTHPVVSSVIHECLHPFVARHRAILRRYTSTVDFTRLADEARMRALGYQWDESTQAKTRVLEESIVRGISIVLAGRAESAERFCEINSETGFVLVPSVVHYAIKHHPSLTGLRAFIEGALEYHLTMEDDQR